MGKRKPSRIFRSFLRLFPAEFRGEYEGEMEQVFQMQRRDAQAGRRRDRILFWWRTFGHMAAAAPAQHWDALRQDVRWSLRMMRRDPFFSLLAVAVLALGIGSSSAVFSVADAALLRPLPYPDPDRLVAVLTTGPPETGNEASFPDLLDWRASGALEGIAAFRSTSLALTGSGDPLRVSAARATSDFFSVLGVEPILGRRFVAQEDERQHGRVVMLSHRFWQSRFGGRTDIVGQDLILGGQLYSVVGILPAEFDFPWILNGADIWGTLAFDFDLEERGARYLNAIGRLKEGISIEEAQQQLSAVSLHLAEQFPRSNAGRSVRLVHLSQHLSGNVRQSLLALLAAVGLVLAAACSNVAGLLLGRLDRRRREMALRAALGAGRSRGLRQLATEGLLLSALGAAAGLGLAWAAVGWLRRLAPEIPRLGEVGIDGRVLALAAALSLLSALAFSLVPALRASKVELNEALGVAARGTSGQSARLRRVLAVSQAALALTLLAGSGLLVKSLQRLLEVDKGFQTEHVLTMRISLPGTRYSEASQATSFYSQLLGRLAALPGVEAVGMANMIPLSGNDFQLRVEIEGRPEPEPQNRPRAQYRAASPGYFDSLGIAILQGRNFSDQDSAQGPPTVIINQEMARRYWPGENPVGLSMRINNFDEPLRRIVGVAADVRHFGLDAEARPEMYVPYRQSPALSYTLVIRASGAQQALLESARREVASLDKDLPLYQVAAMQDLLGRSVSSRRFAMLIFSAFAGIALALSMVGVYGVIAQSAVSRRREIGIRMALGARRSDVLRMIAGEGLALGGLGAVIGLACALALTRLMASMLYQVAPTDPATLAAAAALLLAVALTASCLPARRASRTDPTLSLRQE